MLRLRLSVRIKNYCDPGKKGQEQTDTLKQEFNYDLNSRILTFLRNNQLETLRSESGLLLYTLSSFGGALVALTLWLRLCS